MYCCLKKCDVDALTLAARRHAHGLGMTVRGSRACMRRLLSHWMGFGQALPAPHGAAQTYRHMHGPCLSLHVSGCSFLPTLAVTTLGTL